MPEETNEEVVVASEDTAEVVTEQVEKPAEDATDQEKEDYREKLNIQNRFLKKEGYEFKDGKWTKPTKAEATTQPTQTSNYSLADIASLSKVHEDDIARVEKFAKDEKVSIKEALKNEELKAILNLREENRRVAVGANVTNARRASVKVSDESLVDNARSGKLPEDDADIDRLIAARMKIK